MYRTAPQHIVKVPEVKEGDIGDDIDKAMALVPPTIAEEKSITPEREELENQATDVEQSISDGENMELVQATADAEDVTDLPSLISETEEYMSDIDLQDVMTHERLVSNCSCRMQHVGTPCIEKITQQLEILKTTYDEMQNTKTKNSSKINFVPNRSVIPFRTSSIFKSMSENAASRNATVIGAAPIDTPLSLMPVSRCSTTNSVAMRVRDIIEDESHDITEDVMRVVARVEENRQEIMARLQDQQGIVRKMKKQMHNLQRIRNKRYRILVQKEHSGCQVDIQELEWNLSYQQRRMVVIERKHALTEKMRVKLMKDIDFFSQNAPQVEEKLELEQTTMEGISTAHETVVMKLHRAVKEMKKTEEKKVEMFVKVAHEKHKIKEDIKKVTTRLEDTKHDIQQTLNERKEMTDKQKRGESNIAQMEKKTKLIKIKTENTIGGIRAANKTQREHEEKLADLRSEQSQLEKDALESRNGLENLRAQWKDILKVMQTAHDKAYNKYRDKRQNNNDLEVQCDELESNFEKLKKKLEDNKRNIDRISREMERIQMQEDVVHQELSVVEVAFQQVSAEYKQKLKFSTDQQKTLKATLDTLKNQLAHYSQEYTSQKMRLQADAESLEAVQMDYAKKKKKRDGLIKSVDEQNAKLDDIVIKLRAKSKEKEELVAKLEKELADLKAFTDKVLGELKAILFDLTTERTQKTIQITKLEEEIEFMAKDSIKLKREMKDLEEQIAVMKKSTVEYDDKIELLTADLEELSQQVEWRKNIERELLNEIERINDKINVKQKQHRGDYKDRNDTLEKTLEQIEHNLQYNSRLASLYRQQIIQRDELKHQIAQQWDGFGSVEDFHRSLDELESMQVRYIKAQMHLSTLTERFSTNNLSYLDGECESSVESTRKLKDELSSAISDVTGFLHKQADYCAGPKNFIQPELTLDQVLQEKVLFKPPPTELMQTIDGITSTTARATTIGVES